jgi:glycosyltransferase involved in cell wall biosynthesis
MKVLICNRNRDIRGGVETYLRSVLPRLADLGLQIHFLFENQTTDLPPIDEGVPLDRATELTPSTGSAVWTAIRDWCPDVVLNNGLQDAEFELKLTHFPVVYFAHNYVGTCLSGFKRHAWPSPEPCYRTLGLGCLAYYFPRRCGGLSPLPVLKDYLYSRRQLAMLRRTVQVQVASSAMRAEYLRHGLPAAQVLHNPYFPTNGGPDPLPPTPRERSGIVLLAGRLTEVKGGAYLVKALHAACRRSHGQLPLRLAVAGDGPELPSLRALADELGVPADFHGWLDPARLEVVMRQADLLAVPSLWPEPFGLVGIEAGCFGVPSVGYAHGGITDWLIDGKSGCLAPSPPTVEGLADAIVEAFRDVDRHHQLRVGAWEMAQRFSMDRHLTLLAQQLRSAAEHSSRVPNGCSTVPS